MRTVEMLVDASIRLGRAFKQHPLSTATAVLVVLLFVYVSTTVSEKLLGTGFSHPFGTTFSLQQGEEKDLFLGPTVEFEQLGGPDRGFVGSDGGRKCIRHPEYECVVKIDGKRACLGAGRGLEVGIRTLFVRATNISPPESCVIFASYW